LDAVPESLIARLDWLDVALYILCMHMLAACILLMSVMVSPGWAGAPDLFDPEQPFEQAMSQRLMESLIGQALAALDEHLEISSRVDSDSAGGDQKQGLQLKLYPRGKSHAEEPIVAEGWFGSSQDSSQQEFHLRFALPNRSADPSPDLPANVL